MIGCPSCGAPLAPAQVGTGRYEPCLDCRTPFAVRLFPAAFRGREAAAGAVAAPEEATCFFHPTKRAAVPCEGCGRFLCALCDLEVAGRHLCPVCAAARTRDAGEDRLVRERTLWDSVALSLAVLPMLLFYFTLLTAPAAIFLAIRHWRSPRSLVPRTRFRFVAAIVVASLQLVGWVALVGSLVFFARRAPGG